MEIRRISSQASESLGQFYTRMATTSIGAKTGTAMLKLIDSLNSQPPDRIVWASASETDLMLLLSDDVRGRAFANVRAQGPWYFIECAMAKNSAPWPEAWVKGHTCDLQKACGMIVSGWRWSQE